MPAAGGRSCPKVCRVRRAIAWERTHKSYCIMQSDLADQLEAWQHGVVSDADPGWDARLAELRSYFERHGDTHVGFRDGDPPPLVRWAAKQRSTFCANRLSPSRCGLFCNTCSRRRDTFNTSNQVCDMMNAGVIPPFPSGQTSHVDMQPCAPTGSCQHNQPYIDELLPAICAGLFWDPITPFPLGAYYPFSKDSHTSCMFFVC